MGSKTVQKCADVIYGWFLLIFLGQVLVHHPEDFPLVRDRGFVIGPGQEVFVGVDGADVYRWHSMTTWTQFGPSLTTYPILRDFCNPEQTCIRPKVFVMWYFFLWPTFIWQILLESTNFLVKLHYYNVQFLSASRAPNRAS